MSEQLISPAEVERRTSLSRTEIDRRVAAKTFPQPIRLDRAEGKRGRRIFYVASEIDAWIGEQIAAWRDSGFADAQEVPENVRGPYADRQLENRKA